MERFSHYTYGEGRTGNGQLINFTFPILTEEKTEEQNKKAADIREFLKTQIRDIDIPKTGRANVGHGSHGQYTRFDIKQHKYAGGGSPGCGGFIEVLEIKNPPDNRWGIVINENRMVRSAFTEWDTLKNALVAFSKEWGGHDTTNRFPTYRGFRRHVACGLLTPWFYAIGDEALNGDYAFPDGLQDDPVYRFGRQFVVSNCDGIPIIKTCMGTRFMKEKGRHYPHEESHFRIVCWDDGSVWDESRNNGETLPRPVEESELWITEAIQQFRQFLAGKETEFTINFIDGQKFVGKLKQSDNNSAPCAEGDYYLVVNIKGERKPREGWISNFKPTPDDPDIIQFVTNRLAKENKTISRVEIKERKIKKSGKKWAGTFFCPSQ